MKSAEVRTEELLHAADRVFARRGLSGATVSEITEEAGVAKGSFYRYFDSKEQILGALKARFYAGMIEAVAAELQRLEAEGWMAQVDALVETLVDHFYDRAELVRVFASDPTSAASAELFSCERSLTALIEAGIRAGVDAGAFEVERPALTAALLQHGVVRTAEYALIYAEPIARDDLASAAKELAHRALGV